MKKLCLVLLLVPIFAAGCTRSYAVYVNGFSEVGEPIKEDASIYVAVEPNSHNPIFDREIKAKIEMLLKAHGYMPASEAKLADYRLTFRVGLDSHTESGYAPLYHPYYGFRGRYWGHYHFGYYSYVPYIETYYDQWLVMEVYAREPETAAAAGQVVWIGESAVDTSAADLRQVVNYLLVGAFEYFGHDTGRQMVVRILPDDPAVIELEAVR
jgi:hypothetical protein